MLSFSKYLVQTVKEKGGVKRIYNGWSAGLLRQLCYATSRFGLLEVFRDELAKHRETDFLSRLAAAGVTSGGLLFVSCIDIDHVNHYMLYV